MSHAGAGPCPWCGFQSDETRVEPVPTTPCRQVICGHCEMGGPPGRDAAEALERWNTRPVEDALLEACKALRCATGGWADNGEQLAHAMNLSAAAIALAEGDARA